MSLVDVAIPSNRVNVSYWELQEEVAERIRDSRNPLKSGQCFLRGLTIWENLETKSMSRNPLKSGQCFLHLTVTVKGYGVERGRNPLKSGQCSLLSIVWLSLKIYLCVAIPSNRVNVSYN